MSDQPPEFNQNQGNSNDNSHPRFDDNPPEPVSSAEENNLVSSQHNNQQSRAQSFDPVSSSSTSNFSSVRTFQLTHQSNNNLIEPPREPFNLISQDNDLKMPLPSCSLSQSPHFSNELNTDVPLEPCQGEESVSSTTTSLAQSSHQLQLNSSSSSSIQRNSLGNDSFFQADFQSSNLSHNRSQDATNSAVYENELSSVLSNVTSSNFTPTIASISSSISTQKSPQQSSSFTHPSDPAKFHVDNALLNQILVYGFSEYMAILAIQRTGGAGVEQAVNWIIDHSNASDTEVDYEEENKDQQMGLTNSTPSTEPNTSSSNFLSKYSLANTIAHSLKRSLPHKMIFVANMSLKMGTGKLAAQVGHATLGVYRVAQKTEAGRNSLESWRNHGEVKIVVKGQSTERLFDLFKQAKDAGLYAYLVQDAGYTQIPSGSRTVLGIFGATESVDQITGSLKLL